MEESSFGGIMMDNRVLRDGNRPIVGGNERLATLIPSQYSGGYRGWRSRASVKYWCFETGTDQL